MPDTPRHVLALWAVGLVAVVLLGARYLHRGGQPAAPAAPPIRVGDAAGDGSSRVVVHVAGAVRKPGVYRLPARDRVVDAVHRAGGARHRADLSALNLAAKLEDGRQVVVPVRTPTGLSAPVASGASAAVPGAAPTAPVDLNTATPEQLDTLDGVGPATAQKILEYRQEHGGFGSVEELGQVSGIGPKRLAALRDHVHV
jgi:competence protein ComEA